MSPNGSANRPILIIPADPQPTYSHDLYDVVSLWLIWLPLGLFAGVVVITALVLMSPVLLTLWLVERWQAGQSGAVDRP